MELPGPLADLVRRYLAELSLVERGDRTPADLAAYMRTHGVVTAPDGTQWSVAPGSRPGAIRFIARPDPTAPWEPADPPRSAVPPAPDPQPAGPGPWVPPAPDAYRSPLPDPYRPPAAAVSTHPGFDPAAAAAVPPRRGGVLREWYDRHIGPTPPGRRVHPRLVVLGVAAAVLITIVFSVLGGGSDDDPPADPPATTTVVVLPTDPPPVPSSSPAPPTTPAPGG